MTDRLRLITTHDFFGSFAPVPTSYGSLAGGEGLRAAVNDLRKDAAASLWVDSGDFSQGGPLTLASNGKAGIRACSELGIDVSVVGNHDLDFGVDFLKAEAPNLDFPLLTANADLGLPSTCILETAAGPVGIIGLTHHNLHSMRMWTIADEPSMPDAAVYRPTDVPALASELRSQGARVVLAIVHDGVDWSFDAGGRYSPEKSGFEDRCRSWAASVDAIVAGHTLGRFFGHIEGTPVLQPWPLGSEVGVLDLDLSRGHVEAPILPRGLIVRPGGAWKGHGADIIDAAEADILGRLDISLEARSGQPSGLAAWFAEAIAKVAGTDTAFAYTTCGQPTLDGVFSHLGKGPVTRLQILQMVPYSDFRLMSTRMSAAELDQVRDLVRPRPQSRTTAWAEAVLRPPSGEEITVTTLSQAGTRNIEVLIGRSLDWTEAEADVFDALTCQMAGKV